MFLDQYLNESNDMMISSMSPILTESDIMELKNIEDVEVQELDECFTSDECETSLLVESAELLYESKVNEAIKKAYNRMMLLIDKLIAKIKAFVKQMKAKGYKSKIDKLNKFIKDNIDKLPKDYEFKQTGEYYTITEKNGIVIIENRLIDIINYPKDKTEEDVEAAYQGYKGEKDFYEQFKKDGKFEDGAKVDYELVCKTINDDVASNHIQSYADLVEQLQSTRDKISKILRTDDLVYNNKAAKLASTQFIKLLNLEEYCHRVNINYYMALYKDVYNTIKANM